MKKIILCLFLLSFLPYAMAINLDVTKESSNEVMIYELQNPVIFDLKIKNLGGGDDFSFYNLLGFRIFPVGSLHINSGQTKDVELRISPLSEIQHRGVYSFNYFIRGSNDEEQKEILTFKIINLKDAFEISLSELEPDSGKISINVRNLVNYNFKEITGKFDSAFFDIEKNFSLGAYETKNFTINIPEEDYKKLLAGYYTMNSELVVDGKIAELESVIKFEEKDLLTSSEKDYGFFLVTKSIIKENKGNVVKETSVVIDKNIISRTFTTFSPEPDLVDRQGFNVYYTWNKRVSPGEIFEIKAKTNYLLPFFVIIFIVLIVVFAKKYSQADLILRKKVSFVKAKGGEFALKVSIYINAKEYVEQLNIVDRLPPIVKLYNKFPTTAYHPTRINQKSRKIEWDFDKLEAGETRVLSYIVYSKVGVLGKFALPAASVIYEKNGKIKEANSNKAFFIAEQTGKKDEDLLNE